MKKVLITGGSGTIGTEFIRRYYSDYKFGSISRNERLQHELKNLFPEVDIYVGSVDDEMALTNVVDKFRPEIIIHCAAMKHINLAETNPTQAVKVNLIGSMNVVKAALKFGVPITVGVSTDKACEPTSIYGMTKFLMEKMFIEHNDQSKFVVCRFGNVAFSNGSVLPFWMNLKKEGKPLLITDPRMKRFFFSKKEAVELIHATLTYGEGGFVLVKKLKAVSMLHLAKKISNDIEIVGARPGERFDECLVGSSELPYSHDLGDLIMLFGEPNGCVSTRLPWPYDTRTAELMTEEKMEILLKE